MVNGADSLADRGLVGEALSRLVEEAGIDAPLALQGVDIDDASWFVLGGRDEEIIVATGPWDADGPGEKAQQVRLEKAADGWQVSGWGQCNLSLLEPPGLMWAQVRAEKSSLTGNQTSVTLLISEKECTSARDPRPFLQEPVVVETNRTVTIYWTSTPPEGDQVCPGNPQVRRVVQLHEPLGERQLLDGSTWPPTPVTDG